MGDEESMQNNGKEHLVWPVQVSFRRTAVESKIRDGMKFGSEQLQNFRTLIESSQDSLAFQSRYSF